MQSQLVLRVQRSKRVAWQFLMSVLCGWLVMVAESQSASWIIHTKPVVSDGSGYANPANASLSYAEQGKRVTRQLAQKTKRTISWVQSINADTYVVNIDNEQDVAQLKADATVEWMEPNQRRYINPLAHKMSVTMSQAAIQRTMYEPAILSGITDPLNTGTNLWNLDSVDTGGAKFNQAWKRNTGQKIVIAVVDSGATDHEDLGNPNSATGAWIDSGYTFITDCRISGSCNFYTAEASSYTPPVPNAADLGDGFSLDEKNRADADFRNDAKCVPDFSSWHGTFVASVIAARKNGIGGVGGAYNARILPVRVLGKCGGLLSDIALGMRWAAGLAVYGAPVNKHPARVIVLSLDGDGACTRTEQDAIDEIVKAGAVVIVAAGNESQNIDNKPVTPASCKNVIAVTAHSRAGQLAGYANYGTKVVLSAPGGIEENITPFGDSSLGLVWGAVNGGAYTPNTESIYSFNQGTSFAAPHVAAVVALMLERQSTLKVPEIRWALKQSARAFPSGDSCSSAGAYAGLCGAGLLDADRALDKADEAIALRTTSPIVDDFVATDYSVKPSTGGCTLGYGNDSVLVIAILLGLMGVLRAYSRKNGISG